MAPANLDLWRNGRQRGRRTGLPRPALGARGADQLRGTMTQPNQVHSELHPIQRELTRIQQIDHGPILVLRPVPCGLGGQIHSRVETYLLSLALQRTALFPTLADPPYTQSFPSTSNRSLPS